MENSAVLTQKIYTGEASLRLAVNGYLIRCEYRYKTAMQSDCDSCMWGTEDFVYTEDQGEEALKKLRELHEASVKGTDMVGQKTVNVVVSAG
jgi:hypothetical protein